MNFPTPDTENPTQHFQQCHSDEPGGSECEQEPSARFAIVPLVPHLRSLDCGGTEAFELLGVECTAATVERLEGQPLLLERHTRDNRSSLELTIVTDVVDEEEPQCPFQTNRSCPL
jgi:hypothetical protein